MLLIYLLTPAGLAVGLYVHDDIQYANIIRNSIALFFMIVPFVALLGWSYALGLWRSSWRPSKRAWLILLAVFVATQLWEWGLGLLKSGKTDNDKVIEMLLHIFPTWLMLIYICAIGPICEELLFRGVIMGKMPLKNPWWGIAVSSVAFAAAHMPEDLLAWLMYGGFGVIFALLFYRTKSLLPSTISHIANNTLATILMLYGIG